MKLFLLLSLVLFQALCSEFLPNEALKLGSALDQNSCLNWLNPYRTKLGRPPLTYNGHADCVDNIAKNDHISGVAHKYANLCGPFLGQNECFRLTPNWNFDWCFNQWIAQQDIHTTNLRNANSVSCGYYWDGSLYTLTAFFQ